MSNNNFTRWLTFTALAALLSGCGVLRVDVDVYKGPLANHQQVQLEQMAVMAVGAKPLLATLRDTLEWGDDVQTQRKMNQWHEEGRYVTPPEKAYREACGRPQFFINEQAKQVNMVLGLYEDLEGSKLKNLLHKGTRIIKEEYLPAWKKLEPSTKEYSESYSNYLDARNALEKLWNLAVDALLYVDSNAYTGANKELLIRAIAPIIANTTNPQRLNEAVASGVYYTAKKEGNHIFGGPLWSEKWSEENEKEDFPYEAATKELTNTLEKHPTVTARLLRQLNIQYKFDKRHQATTDPLAVQYGFIRGASLNPNDNLKNNFPEFEELDALVRDALAAKDAATPWQRARLEQGLETTIENYLKAVGEKPHSPPDQDQDPESSKRLLLRELVRFSEKVLAVANHEELVNSSNIGATSCPDHGIKHGSASRDDIDEFVTLLQAIGNSILVQANELTHRREHRNLMAGAAKDMEHAGLYQGLNKLPDEVFAQILADLAKKKSTAMAQAGSAARALSAATKKVEELQQKLADKTTARPALENNLTGASNKLNTQLSPIQPQVHALQLLQGAPVDAGMVMHQPALLDPAKEVDAPALTSAVANWGNPLNGKAFLGKLQEWLTQRATAGLPTPSAFDCSTTDWKDPQEAPALIRLKCAETYFASLSNLVKNELESIAEAEPAAVKAAYTAALTRYYKLNLARNEALLAEQAAASQKLVNADAELKQLQQNLAQAKVALAAATEIDAAVKTKSTQHTSTYDLVARLKPGVISTVYQAQQHADPAKVFQALLSAVSAEIASATAANDQAKKTAAEQALAELKARAAPTPADFVNHALPSVEYKSRTEVLDMLITKLRHEHIEAVRQNGKDDGHARHLEQALELAYYQRSGMVYIRPPSAYLRSSMAASALQENPRLQWQNMLQRRILRGLPLISEDATNYEERGRLRALQSIDKQFWQNINSVRVSGSGDTNYAVAKDDIGNWYIKQFSADPAPIMKAARNLGLYNLGAGLDINLLRRMELQDVVDSESSSADQRSRAQQQLDQMQEYGTTGSAGLERVYNRYFCDYAKNTLEQYANLHSKAGNNALATDLQETWLADVNIVFKSETDGSVKKTFVTELTAGTTTSSASLAAVEQVFSETPPITVPAECNGEQAYREEVNGIATALVKALQHIRRFGVTANYQIASMPIQDATVSADENLPGNRNKAAQLMRVKVRNLIVDVAEDQKDQLNQFEQAVIFVGEASQN